MTRQRKIEEELWDDSAEKLSSDHVVERFFSQHARDASDAARRLRPGAKPRRRLAAGDPDTDGGPPVHGPRNFD